MTNTTETQVTYLGRPAVRITTAEPRELRRIRREIQARGYWVLTTNDPTYALIAHPGALKR